VSSRPLVIAHRGASAIAPENTIEAFERAIAAKADMIELDVRRTRDGELVVQHDPIEDGTPGPPPATLVDALELARSRIPLDIELKEHGYEDAVLRCIGDHLGDTPYVLTSFLDDAVAAVKALDASIKTGLIVEDASFFETVERAASCGAELIAAHVGLVDAGFAKYATQRGYAVYVWTVNDRPRLLRYLRGFPLAGIITDDPRTAVDVRSDLGFPAQVKP
jgi:glycerophosphoryl diester phosphodiesterase